MLRRNNKNCLLGDYHRRYVKLFRVFIFMRLEHDMNENDRHLTAVMLSEIVFFSQ